MIVLHTLEIIGYVLLGFTFLTLVYLAIEGPEL